MTDVRLVETAPQPLHVAAADESASEMQALGRRAGAAAPASGHGLLDDTAAAAASLSVANGGDARAATCGSAHPDLHRSVVDVDQIVYALERSRDELRAQADRLHDAGDYGAEFWAEDADRMGEAIALVRSIQTGHPAVFVNPPAVVLAVKPRPWFSSQLARVRWDWFCDSVRTAYRTERRAGRWPVSAAARAVHFAATTPF